MGLRRFFDRMRGRRRRRGSRRDAHGSVYEEDGLRSIHNHDFVRDPAFAEAYARAVRACGKDYRWRWRMHVGLWAARACSTLEGDFVECGVNRGGFASAVMQFLDWDALGKTFWLLDTWKGMDARFVSDEEKRAGMLDWNERALSAGRYETDLETVRANFASWRNVHLVPGSVPETLTQVEAERVALLHLDMNCAPPETAAAAFFWPRLVPGAFLLLDDYAYRGFGTQKAAMDAFALERGVSVLALPTGQGLIVKPPVGASG